MTTTMQPYQVILPDGRLQQKFDDLAQAIRCADSKGAKHIRDASTNTIWIPKNPANTTLTAYDLKKLKTADLPLPKFGFAGGIIRKGSKGGILIKRNTRTRKIVSAGCNVCSSYRGNVFCTYNWRKAQPTKNNTVTLVKPIIYRKFEPMVVLPVVEMQVNADLEARRANLARLTQEAYQQFKAIPNVPSVEEV